MNRRNLLTGAAAISVFTPGLAQATLAHPDAELIAACERFLSLLTAYNCELIEGDERGTPPDTGPASIAFYAARDLIAEAKPRTWDGVFAKARAAHADAAMEDGTVADLCFTSDASAFAWDVVQDLLRLAGDGA